MNNRLLQPAFTSGEVSPAIAARIDLQLYDSAAKKLKNAWVHPSGGASKVPGTRFVAQVRGNGRARLIPFVFSSDQVFVLEFTPGHMRVIGQDGVVTGPEGTPFDLAMPYGEADLPGLRYVQSNDVIYLAHAAHPPRKIMRMYDAGLEAIVWRTEEVAFEPKIAAPQNAQAAFSVAASSAPAQKVWRYKVTAVHGLGGEESLPSAVAAVTGTESMRVGVMKSDGSAMPDWYATVRWGKVPEANEYRVYKEKGDGLYGYIGSSTGLSFEDKNINPNMDDTPPEPGNPFAGGNNPAVVTIYQQRATYAFTPTHPASFYMSRSGNFENFTKSTFIKDDDYIEGQLDSQNMNFITWMRSLRSLIVGTTGAVWEISGGSSKSVTPSGISASIQSSRSSAMLDPVIIDNVILHVSRSGRNLHDLIYNFGADSYDGEDRSLMASHLFTNRRITEIAYQESPNSVVWCVMDDGKLLGLTYMQKHQIFAWHQHDTAGQYENICVLPGSRHDNVFFVVQRQINGQTVRYIEMLADPLEVPDAFQGMSDAQQVEVLAQAFYVHSGLSYSSPPGGAPLTILEGLEHLEGQEVAILADASVEPRQTVRDGKIRLRHPARRVQVGLPYTMAIDTINYEPPAGDGVAIGKPKRIARVVARIENSTGFHVGINGQTVQTKWRTNEPWGTPPRLRSGVFEYSVPGKWGRESCVSFKSPEPVPFTVNTVVPVISTAD